MKNTIKKTKSGKWHCSVYLYTEPSGKRVYKSITADLKSECERLVKETIKSRDMGDFVPNSGTVRQSIERYISLSQMLSPSTIHGYQVMLKHGFKNLLDLNVSDLTDQICQSAINLEAKRPNQRTGKPLSPKFIKNEWTMISAALRSIDGKSFNVRLPKLQRVNKDLPEPSVICNAISGKDIELPCLLAMWLSFSMSEIRGIKCSSIRNGCVYIDGAKVTVGSEDIYKDTAKTSTRIRKQRLPEHIQALIEEQPSMLHYRSTGEDGFLCPYSVKYIRYHFQKALEPYGIEMTFHDLRHEFASIMLTKLQVPDRIVQTEGGWSTDRTLKAVYSNNFSEDQSAADDKRDEYFSKIIDLRKNFAKIKTESIENA